MLYFEIAVSMIMFFAIVIVLICLITGRIKPRPVVPGNGLWIFYLIEKMFEDNNSSTKEVKENELP